MKVNNVNSCSSLSLNEVYCYDIEELNSKILKLLKLDNNKQISTSEIEEYVKLFEIENDFKCIKNDMDTKTIYTIKLTKS
jgi:hypothetical protein